MFILSQNVNGIRARIKAGFCDTINELNPDIICLQEFRAKEDQLPRSFLPNYIGYHSIHEKPGYAGASTYVRKDIAQPFLAVDTMNLGDKTGRVSILDFKDFKLINAYVPNVGQHLERLAERLTWQTNLLTYVEQQLKPVIITGDLNVAPTKLDTNTHSQAGTTAAERLCFKELLDLGLVDVFRTLHPKEISYTFFSNINSARENNKGMRLDHFLISKELLPRVAEMGHITDPKYICKSDHNPIYLKIL